MIKGISNDKNSDDRLARLIIGCAFAVGSGLGNGFFEKVYENALANKLGHDWKNPEAYDADDGSVVDW